MYECAMNKSLQIEVVVDVQQGESNWTAFNDPAAQIRPLRIRSDLSQAAPHRR